MRVKITAQTRVRSSQKLIPKSITYTDPLADISHMYTNTNGEITQSPPEEHVKKVRLMLSETVTFYVPPDLTKIIEYHRDSEYPPKQFLLPHGITPAHRINMLDWMIEIFDTYNTNFSSYYFAVAIQDAFFYKTNKNLQFQELGLLGVVSLFIASKYNDRGCLSLDQISEICKDSFTSVVIQDFELELLNTIQFNVHQKHAYCFLKMYQGVIADNFDKQGGTELFEISAYLLKLVLFDYEIVSSFKQSQIAAATLLCICYLLNKKQSNFPLIEIITELKDLGIEVTQVNEVSSACESVMRNYRIRYPQVKNIYKYNEYADSLLQNLLKI